MAHLRERELLATGRARADLWRAGSSWAEDWVLEAELQIEGGQLWIVQQSGDLAEEWRWGGDERRTYLQRRRPGETVETLASFPATIAPGRRHRLRLIRRGTGVWVEWDGKPIAERPAYLPDRWRGNVGLVTWGGGEEARLSLTQVKFASFPYLTRAMGARPSAEEVQAAIREAGSLSALSPRWLEATRTGLQEQAVDKDLMAILSRRYGWEIVPTLRVRPGAEAGVGEWLPEAFARAKRDGWSGVRLDLEGLPDAAERELSAFSNQYHAAEGLRLVLEPESSRRVAGNRAAARAPAEEGP
jgi:hypothetical protein